MASKLATFRDKFQKSIKLKFTTSSENTIAFSKPERLKKYQENYEKGIKEWVDFSSPSKNCSGTIKPYVGPLIDQGINTSQDKLDEDFFHKEVQVEIPIQGRSSKIS